MKTKIFVATCLAFSVISSSCSDFLTEDPKGQMVQNNYFSSQNDLDGAVYYMHRYNIQWEEHMLCLLTGWEMI